MHDWNPQEEPAKLQSVRIGDVEVGPGDRVRLHPNRSADIMDLALAGKIATVAAVEVDYENHVHLAVTVDDDPGRDFGQAGKIAHRFFFRPDEVEPVGDPPGRSA